MNYEDQPLVCHANDNGGLPPYHDPETAFWPRGGDAYCRCERCGMVEPPWKWEGE